MRMKRCSKCKQIRLMPSRTATMCRPCYDTPDEKSRRKASGLKRNYGLSLEDFNTLLEQQRHCCALCRKPFSTGHAAGPAVDHDHNTGAIRGILHNACNSRLGSFGDDPDLLDAAALYLRTSRTPHAVGVRGQAERAIDDLEATVDAWLRKRSGIGGPAHALNRS